MAKRRPPTAGPTTTAVCPATDLRATAPARSSDGTISGVNALSAGPPTTAAIPDAAASTRKGHRLCAPSIVTTSSPPTITVLSAIALAPTARLAGDGPRDDPQGVRAAGAAGTRPARSARGRTDSCGSH